MLDVPPMVVLRAPNALVLDDVVVGVVRVVLLTRGELLGVFFASSAFEAALEATVLRLSMWKVVYRQMVWIMFNGLSFKFSLALVDVR